MNIQTINYIGTIAGSAAAKLKAGATLKASKAYLLDCMSEENTPFVNHDGVDFEAVNNSRGLINAALINTKFGFTNQLEKLVERMNEAREENTFNFRVAQAIKSAEKNHGVVIHAADVIAWANGDVYFNFTQCANELAKAETVEAIATKAGLFTLWETLDNSPLKMHIDNLEYHYVEARNDEYNGGDPATAPQRLFGFNKGDTLRDVFRAVVGQAEEDLQIHIEQCHAEALSLNAALSPEESIAVKRMRVINGRPVYRVSIRGRHYLYTDGDTYAQLRVKQKGGSHHYRTVNSAYMMDKIRRAVAKR